MKPLRSLTTLLDIRDGIEIHQGYSGNFYAIGIHLLHCKYADDLNDRIEDALMDAERDLFPAVYLHDGGAK